VDEDKKSLRNVGIYIPINTASEETRITKKVKLKFSRYRPGVAQRVGRGIVLLFHDRGTRRE